MKSIVRHLVVCVAVACGAVFAHAAAAQAKSAGELVITSKPDVVEFEVISPANLSIRQGRTPATIDGLEPGRYRVIFREAGCVGQRYPVTIGAGVANVVGDLSLQMEGHKLRVEIAARTAQIAIGTQISQQLGPNLLRDLAVISLRKEAVEGFLAKHGYKVQQAAPDDGKGGTKKAPPSTPRVPAPPNKESAAAPKGAAIPPDPATASVAGAAAPSPAALPTELGSADWNAQAQKAWTDEIAQLQKTKADQEAQVASSMAIQQKLQELVTDLLELAKTDADAAEVVIKWKIQKSPPAAPQ